MKENDFSDKTIIPFATSASSDFNLDNLTPLAANADWGEARRFSSNVDEDEIITHAAFYCGWPKAWAVFRVAKEIWSDKE